MTIKIPTTENIEQTNDIVIGKGVVPSLPSHNKPITWVLPGYRYTQDKELATQCAHRLDQMIQANNSNRNQRMR